MIVHFQTTAFCSLDWKTGIESDSEYWFDVDQISIKGSVFKFFPRCFHYTGGMENHEDLNCFTFDLQDARLGICIDLADLEFLIVDGNYITIPLSD